MMHMHPPDRAAKRSARRLIAIAALFLFLLPLTPAYAGFSAPTDLHPAIHTNQDKVAVRRFLLAHRPVEWSHTNQDIFDPPGDPQSLPGEGIAIDDFRPVDLIASDAALATSAAAAFPAFPARDPVSAMMRPVAVMGVPGPGALAPFLLLPLVARRRRPPSCMPPGRV